MAGRALSSAGGGAPAHTANPANTTRLDAEPGRPGGPSGIVRPRTPAHTFRRPNAMPASPPPTAASVPASTLNNLKRAITNRKVVLVLGPQALTVRGPGPDGQPCEAPFYRLVATQLLANHGLPPELLEAAGSAWDLHRACAAVLESDPDLPVMDVRMEVAEVIQALSQQVEPVGALAGLAQLDCFDLVVNLTPDTLFHQALVRAQPQRVCDVRHYSPSADSRTAVDIDPVNDGDGILHIHHLLGRVSEDGEGEFAIHEEDALEFLHQLHRDVRRLPNLLAELQDRHRVFIGSDLSDWLGRSLMRFANRERLAEKERLMEFFSARSGDAALTTFISRYCKRSAVFPWEPTLFVQEISKLAQPQPGARPIIPGGRTPPATVPAPRRGTGPTAFVSYASEDAVAARRIADTLLALGFGDVWLDRRKLVVGDDWSDSIDDAINGCDYFVPVLSDRANARREGVFWQEWRKALDRAERVRGAFILPIGIDDGPTGPARHPHIFSGETKAFLALHLLHAPEGVMGEDVRDSLRRRATQP